MSSLTFSTQSVPAVSVYIVLTNDKNVVFDKMFAATQGLLWLALVAATSATPGRPMSDFQG